MPLMNWKDEAYLRKAPDGRFIPLVCFHIRVVLTLKNSHLP